MESSIRLSTPVLRISRPTWAFTVRSSIPNWLAISRFERASKISSSTWHSRAVKCGLPLVRLVSRPLSRRSISLERSLRGAQIGSAGHGIDGGTHQLRPGSEIEIRPGAGDDRIEDQFIVALRPDNDQTEIRPGAPNQLQSTEAPRRGVHVEDQILESGARQQFLKAAGNRDEPGQTVVGFHVENTDQAGKANGLVCHKAHMDGFRTSIRWHLAFPHLQQENRAQRRVENFISTLPRFAFRSMKQSNRFAFPGSLASELQSACSKQSPLGRYRRRRRICKSRQTMSGTALCWRKPGLVAKRYRSLTT